MICVHLNNANRRIPKLDSPRQYIAAGGFMFVWECRSSCKSPFLYKSSVGHTCVIAELHVC